MSFSRDHLVWKALCALYEVSQETAKRPVPRTFLLRFTLAFLYQAAGAPKDRRWVYEGFWRDATRKVDVGEYYDRNWAHRDTTSAINGILHDLGWETTPDTFWAMREALESILPPEERTQKLYRREGPVEPWSGYAKALKETPGAKDDTEAA